MLGLFRPSYERKLVQYCIDLYSNLQVDIVVLFLVLTFFCGFQATSQKFEFLKSVLCLVKKKLF